MPRKPVNILSLVLIADSLLFIILYIILSSNARLASDDFYYMYLKNTYGAWGGMAWQYDHWSGRWSAHSVACWLLSFSDKKNFLLVLHMLTLGGLYISIRALLSKIFSRLAVQGTNILLPGLSILFIISF